MGSFDFPTTPLCDTKEELEEERKINSLTFFSFSWVFPSSFYNMEEDHF